MGIKRFFHPLILLLAAALWGFAFVAQEKASGVGAFALGAARSALATVFLTILIIVFDKITKNGRRLVSKSGIDFTKSELIGGCVSGLALTVASAFQQLGINQGTDSGKAAFVTALYVVLVPVYALALKKRAPINVWISVVIAVVGFYLLCIKNGLSILPSDALVLACAFTFPLQILSIDHFSKKCDCIRLSCIQFASAAVFNTAISLVLEEPVLEMSHVIDAFPSVLYLGIVSSGIAYTLQIVGQKGVNPTAATLIMSLESVFGVIGATLIIGTRLEPREYVGCAVVLSAVIISQLEFKKTPKKSFKE